MKKLITGLLTVLIILHYTPCGLAFITDGLIGYYPFNGNAADESGNNNHGTIQGAVLTEDRLGRSNSACSFDADAGGLIVLDSTKTQTLLNGLNALTVVAWVYNEGPGEPYRNILRLCDTGLDSRGLMFRIGAVSVVNPSYPNKLEVLLSTTDFPNQYIASATDVPVGAWTQLAFSYDGLKICLYMNGQYIENVFQNGAPVSNGVTQTGAVAMGTDDSALSFFAGKTFHGAIDDVRIYDRALSADEINVLYEDVCDCTLAVLNERKRYDPSGDGVIGLEEAVYALQVVAGITPPDTGESGVILIPSTDTDIAVPVTTESAVTTSLTTTTSTTATTFWTTTHTTTTTPLYW